jgi:hypothetical protein
MVKKVVPLVSVMDQEILERAIYRAFKKKGWLFAQTEEEVGEEEARQAIERTHEVHSTSARYEVSVGVDGVPEPIDVLSTVSLIDDTITEGLARAARSGKEIPVEIEERMHRDRAASEGGTE